MRHVIQRSLISMLVFGLVATVPAWATDSSQFRGPERDGIYDESNLMQTWPEGGPERLWIAKGLGEGFATVSVADGWLYTTGMKDQEGSAFAFDTDGKLQWSTHYGAESSGGGYPGTRTTPTVADGKLFLMSSMGHALALDAKKGDILWRVDLLETFGVENPYFGISESPLVVDDKVIFTPGGKDASVVALSVADGKVVWTTKGLSEASAYCNPRLFDDGKRRQIITLLASTMVGIDPDNGKVLWTQEYPATYDIHATSPLFHGDLIYVSDGYDQGGKAFRLASDGMGVTEVWTEKKLDIHHGGGVLVNGYIYGAASKKTWYVLDADTGEIVATIPRLGKGSVTYADGRIYGYTEDGKVVLVDPDPKNFKVVGELEIKDGEGHHWAHPVVNDGVLYIRHGDVLMAYDVSAKKAEAAPASAEG